MVLKKYDGRKFKSPEHRRKLSEALKGEKSPNWKGGVGVELICPVCGNKFKRHPLHLKNVKNPTCSRRCSGLLQQKRVTIICKNCGKEFEYSKKRVEDGERTYCSIKCKTEHFRGPNNPLWIKDNNERRYCHLFNEEFKERVREFFNRECVNCGKDEQINGKKLSVHHVAYDKQICCNEDKPLFLALCERCHNGTNSKSNREEWEELFYYIIEFDFNGQCYLPKGGSSE